MNDNINRKHGEIGDLEDSKAAPEKVFYQYMGKNQKLAPQVPQTPHFVILIHVISVVNMVKLMQSSILIGPFSLGSRRF